ncbi:MAG: helix-turn-helix transcriptional regulator [Clostridia bacterium]|jgi:transcriptional regulator with XRE-family HTH domain|nr:helix-turn-helix transcriptional regulator [Clostridia bacterium]
MLNHRLFSERLKEFMDEYELNETALSEKIKMSRVSVSGILNGAHDPSTKFLINVAELFHCSADYLLGLTDYPKQTEFEPVKDFGICFRKFLKDYKTSQYYLKKELHISSSLTYKWLYKNTTPSVNMLIKLAKRFGCSVDYLLGREK